MESLVFVVLNSTFFHKQIYVTETQLVAEKYFGDVQAISILSRKLGEWTNLSWNKTILVQSKNNTSYQHNAVILDCQDILAPEYIQNLHRTDITKVLALTTWSEVSNIAHLLWKSGICNFLMAVKDEDHVSVLNHDFVSCDEPPKLFLGTDNKKMYELNIKPCYTGRIYNVSFMNFPPFALYKNGRMLGFEGLMVGVAASKLGFSVRYLNRGETQWGHFFPPSGLLGDISRERSVLGFGALFPFAYRFQNADAISFTMEAKLAWAVPIGAGPNHPTWFIILVSEFSSLLWIMIFITFCILTGASIFLSSFGGIKLQKIAWPFYNLALLIGIPQRLVHTKSMTLGCMVGGFLLTAHYQTMMNSKLTAPAKIAEIRTLRELADSGLELQGPQNARAIVVSIANDTKDPAYVKIAGNMKAVNTDFDDVLLQMVTQRNVGFCRHGSNMIYKASLRPETAGKIHLVEQTTLNYMPIAIFQKHSCLTSHVRNIFQRLHENGLSTKWVKDVSETRESGESRGPRKLSIADIKGFILLLLFGWVISLISFICEFLFHYLTLSKFCVSHQSQPRLSEISN